MNRLGRLVLLLFTGVACTRSPASSVAPASAGANLPLPETSATMLRAASVSPVASAPPGSAEAPAVAPVPEPTVVVSAPTSGGKSSHPMGLTIQFNPLGTSVLRNQTERAHSVLHDAMLQPSRLEVRDAQGNVVAGFDGRATAKFDNTVRKSAFREVAAGGELPLFELVAVKRDELWELRWGPFRYTGLRAGNYTGVVVFESRVNRYFDEATHATRELPNTWLGTARSEPVSFRLPLR
jgi:hypothetical protein